MSRLSIVLLVGLSAAMVGLAYLGSNGFFIIDEVIYFMGAHAFHETGGFIVENGFETIGADELKIWLLVEGAHGLVPQYPAGTAIFGGLLISLFGQNALIALNVAAGIGTLCAAHVLARRLFGSMDVANLTIALLALCTFWAEYVVGHWPHSVSVFFTTVALWFFFDAQARETGAWRPAAWAGLAVGFGTLFRLDGVLLLPAFAAATILYAPRPVHVFAGGAAGLAPTLTIVALTNQIKFGTWNVFSYGGQGGGTNISGHVTPAVAILLALVVLILVRAGAFSKLSLKWILIAGAVAGFSVLLVTPLASVLSNFTNGVEALLIDATVINDPRSGVQTQPDGTLLFWGLPKKALGQSLPWLGCLALLFGVDLGESRRSVLTVLVVFVCWSLPFLMLSWHGGLGSNMRYFLPVIPALTSVAAWLMLNLVRSVVGGWRLAVLGGVAGLLGATLWSMLAPESSAQLHQGVSTYLLCVIATIAFLAGRIAHPVTLNVAIVAIFMGTGLASILARDDVVAGQLVRQTNAARAEAANNIQGRVVFYGRPEDYSQAIGNDNQFLAIHSNLETKLEAEFVNSVCKAGYHLIISRALIELMGLSSGDFSLRRDVPDISFAQVRCKD